MGSADARLFLAGRYQDGTGERTEFVVSPVTGEKLAEVPVPSTADIETAVVAAQNAFAEYRHTSTYERAALCHRVAELIEEHADELARLTTIEQGKPLEAEARGDVADSAELFAVSAEDAKRLYGSTIPSVERDKRIFTYRKPGGVWAAITPWNFPLMIMAEFLAPALATGNAIVCKPPVHTPLAGGTGVDPAGRRRGRRGARHPSGDRRGRVRRIVGDG